MQYSTSGMDSIIDDTAGEVIFIHMFSRTSVAPLCYKTLFSSKVIKKKKKVKSRTFAGQLYAAKGM